MKYMCMIMLAIAACATPETEKAPDAGENQDAAVSDAPSLMEDASASIDADTRRPCGCDMPCQNGVCCGEDGYCFVPEDDPLRCVYGSPAELPDAGVCDDD